MLQLTSASPVRNPAAVAAMSKRAYEENPVLFAAGQGRTGEITRREFPIKGLLCSVEITVSGTDGNESINEFGLLNLIENIEFAVDGSDKRFVAPGKALETIHLVQNGRLPFANFDPANPGTYTAYFYVKFDVGGYRTLLYAGNNNTLNVNVDWNDRDDVIVGGTAVIDSAELNVQVDYIHGGIAGEFGGKGNHYQKSYLLSQTVQVDGTLPDMLIEKLTHARGYHGLTVFSYDENGSLTDDIVKSLKLNRSDATHREASAANIRAENFDKYQLTTPDPLVGVLDYNFVDAGHPEHVLSVTHQEAMELKGSVVRPAGGDGQILLVSQYLQG